MALLDRERNWIVLRVVYDGPPEAGKTTSLRALAGSLGRTLESPAEQDGRTLYFDWMDYTGGRFEGYQIRCQIVSVPGQPELRARRRHLLGDADVVVFVADSTRAGMAPTLGMLGELPELVLGAPPPPVGVILQANKRDRPDAVPLGELRSEVQRVVGGAIGVVESVASEGTGIRETFVFAVRLALDRVREQLRLRTLPQGRPAVDSGAALFEDMQRADAESQPLAAPALRQVLTENDPLRYLSEFAPWHDPDAPVVHGDGPWPPDAAAPSGTIWPPVEGRLVLHEAAAPRMTTHKLRNGGWAAGIGNGWRAYSSGDAVYADLEHGRDMLIRWARLHVACAGVLSPQRCIVLAATGQGDWRLWQIVRAEKSLRDQLDDISHCTTEEAAARILEAATTLSEIGARLKSATCAVPCTLDTVARGERGPMYVGLMPMERAGGEPGPRSTVDLTAQLGSELESILYNALFERRTEVLAALARASRRGPATRGLLQQLIGGLPAG